jgi:hypothetical protein
MDSSLQRVKSILGKDKKSVLWAFAQEVGLDSTTWGKFLGSTVSPEVADEFQGWSIDEWKRYLQQKAPELIDAEKDRLEKRAKNEEAKAKAYEHMLETVVAILPPQPWPAGIHKEVADKLDICKRCCYPT